MSSFSLLPSKEENEHRQETERVKYDRENRQETERVKCDRGNRQETERDKCDRENSQETNDVSSTEINDLFKAYEHVWTK